MFLIDFQVDLLIQTGIKKNGCRQCPIVFIFNSNKMYLFLILKLPVNNKELRSKVRLSNIGMKHGKEI